MTIKQPRIHRAAKPQSFTLNYATAQDRSLSFEARGMLVYLLSKPTDWIVQPSDLEQQCGRDKVYRILHELIEAGYINRLEIRNEKGQHAGIEYLVYETPNAENQDAEKPDNTTEREKQQRDQFLAPDGAGAKSDPISQTVDHIEAVVDVHGGFETEKSPASESASGSPERKVALKESPPAQAKPKQPPQYGDCVVAFREATGIDVMKRVGEVIKALLATYPDAMPDEIRQFYQDWRMKKGTPDEPLGEISLPVHFGRWRKWKAAQPKKDAAFSEGYVQTQNGRVSLAEYMASQQ